MKQSPLSDMTVAQVLDRWQQTAAVFVRFRMACVGCPLSCFESLEGAAQTYGLPPEQLIREIAAVIVPGENEQQSSE